MIAPGLLLDLSVPVQAQPAQVVEYPLRTATYNPWLIQVFHAQQEGVTV